LAKIGKVLRAIRAQWGFSLRDVRKRSLELVDAWGSRSYEISGSWLCKVERGNLDIPVPKLISLATIYSRPPEELLRHCLPTTPSSGVPRHGPEHSTANLVKEGSLVDLEERSILPDGISAVPIPEHTMLLPVRSSAAPVWSRRAIVGSRDRALYPMIKPGSILKIDTRRKAIASPKDWTTEFDRPIYLLETHKGLVSGWCELDSTGQWLTLITHNLSRMTSQRWRYKHEIEVIGRAVAVGVRLTSPLDEKQGED